MSEIQDQPSNTNTTKSELDRKLHNTSAMLYDELKDFQIIWKTCTLRSINPNDAHDIYLWASNPAIYKKRLTWKKEWYDEQDAAYFIDYVDSEHQKVQKRVLWIDVEWHIAGIVSLTKNEFPYDCTAFLWVWLNPTYQGRGIAKEAVLLMTDNAKVIFPDLIRIEARLFETNEVIPHILEKLDFVKEAKLHNRIKYNDKVMDEIIYAKYLEKPEQIHTV